MKQILASFLSFDYWQVRTYLLVVAVCLFLALAGRMPDSSGGWIHQPEHPLGVYCLKRPTKGQRRRCLRQKRRQARFYSLCYQSALEYIGDYAFFASIHSFILAVFFHLVAPSFYLASLLPLLLFCVKVILFLCPTLGSLPELHLLHWFFLTVSRILMLSVVIVLTSEVALHLSPYFKNDSILFMAGFQLASPQATEVAQTVESVERRTRKCKSEKKEQSRKKSKRICIPIEQDEYNEIIEDSTEFRKLVDSVISQFPKLFPEDIKFGYKLHGKLPTSKKMPEVVLRRIKLTKKDDEGKSQVFTIAPSFVMPYMAGYVDEVEKALFLHNKFGVPYWGLTYVFGRYDMYWYRLVQSFSRNSIVGTTVKSADKLPEDLLADEKHTKINGQKAYIATTVGADCILGASISEKADTNGLTEAYGHFGEEAEEIAPNYEVKTINTDGWSATVAAWKNLSSNVVPVRCFLHGFIKIRSCAKKHPLFHEISTKVWEIYHSANKQDFISNVKTFEEWSQENITGTALDSIKKLCKRVDEYALAYDHPTAYRTSNMIDRHMEPMDRYLTSTRYFHGHLQSAEEGLRAWALMHNFQPYCPRSKVSERYVSPAHKLNGFVYHENWLENLLVSASMGGIPC